MPIRSASCILALLWCAAQSQSPPLSAQQDDPIASALRQYTDILTKQGTQRQIARLLSGWDPRPPSCTGTSLYDCFGGDVWCSWWGTLCDARDYTTARLTLVQQLDSIVGQRPNDAGAIGQLITFALVDGDFKRAWRATESCTAIAWRCHAFRGFVMHAQAPGSGQAQFDSALASAPVSTLAFLDPADPLLPDRGLHCEWRGVGYFLDGGLLRSYLSSPCGANTDFESRFWWLSDPLWSEPGNARWGEHVARNIAMQFHREHYRYILGPIPRTYWHSAHAIHPEWTRNGFFNSWRTHHAADGSETLQLFVNGGYSFVPTLHAISDPLTSRPEDWQVYWDEGPERMHVREAWYNIEDHQTAVLYRGDHLLVVSAARLPLLTDAPQDARAVLAMGRPSDLHVEVTPLGGADPGGVVRGLAQVDLAEWLLSLEVRGQGWVARVRHGAAAPVLRDGFGLSSPVFVDERYEGGGLELVQALRPGTTLRGGTAIGVYFEVYGVESAEQLGMSVSMRRAGRSFFRRIANALRVTSDAALSVSWQEAAEVGGLNMSPRYIRLDDRSLEPGEYDLEVEVTAPRGRVARASRRVVVQ